MNPHFYFSLVFLLLLFLIILFDRKYFMLRDVSTAATRPYSYSRVQLAWWTIIILTSLISVILRTNAIPTFDSSTIILLGMSAATTASAAFVDISDRTKFDGACHQNVKGENFFLDILSDQSGVSIHRFQTVVINITFGCWFIYAVLHNLPEAGKPVTDITIINHIIPVIENNNLILLGVSAGAYAALKTTENKQVTAVG
jgi:hypothetical protein